MDQVRPQASSLAPTMRTLDWSTYPLKSHQVAASAPTLDRSTTPAERMSRELVASGEGLDNPPGLARGFASGEGLGNPPASRVVLRVEREDAALSRPPPQQSSFLASSPPRQWLVAYAMPSAERQRRVWSTCCH
jgi:hypothetical protein